MSEWKLAPGLAINDSEVNHVKPTWTNSVSPQGKISPTGDKEYVNLWIEHFADFSGKILEIGAGNGFLAHNILQKNSNVEYSILDLEAHFKEIQHKLKDYPDVNFIKSSEYKKIFEQDWDLIIETHCLSETPQHYYTDIFDNLSVKSCFVIDYGNADKDPVFQPSLDKWFEDTFEVKERFTNNKLLGGDKRNIPVYIGKS
jgi:phospholipid N-methyltransferase